MSYKKTVFYLCITVFVLLLISLNYDLTKFTNDYGKRIAKYLNNNILNEYDANEMQFDDIANTYCNVYLLNNSRKCLNKMQTYDTNNYIIEFTKIYKPIYYHTFWEINETSLYERRILKLNVLSYLATQNLTHTRLILWTLKNLEMKDELKAEFKKYFNSGVLEVRLINLTYLCSKGVFEKYYKDCIGVRAYNKYLGYVEFSDFVRFLVLYNYGGIYVDGDVIFLRDMRPFWNKNFVYRWSRRLYANTAVIGLKSKRSIYIEKIYEEILGKYSNVMLKAFHPVNVKEAIFMETNDSLNYTDLKFYHSALFDPIWICHDGIHTFLTICKFEEFYMLNVTQEKFDLEGFFKGAFTYHQHFYHGRNIEIKNNTYVYLIEEKFRSKLNEIKWN